jgi:hypothetical protein
MSEDAIDMGFQEYGGQPCGDAMGVLQAVQGFTNVWTGSILKNRPL